MTAWVLLAGLPGTGKSTLARALKDRLGPGDSVAILDKDRIREAIFSAELTDYSAAQDELCARTMVSAAEYLTGRGGVDLILFDGRTFSRARQIEDVIAAAERCGAAWRIVHLDCPPEVAEARLATSDPVHPAHPARNRGVDLYRRLQREFEPISRPHLEINSSQPIDAAVERLSRYVSGGSEL